MIGAGSALLLLTWGPALAQSDGAFVKSAIQTNLAEIQLGQLAQEKGSSDAVKAYGQQLVDDHSKANEEAVKLASAAGVTPPEQPSPEDKKVHDELSALSGEAFDQAFARHMVQGHQKAIEMFTDKADDEKTEVTSFAEKNLPVLQHHLEEAKTLPGASG